MKTINTVKPEEAVPDALLERSFEACWPKLQEKLRSAESSISEAKIKKKPVSNGS
jgi:hypothetical protein